MPEHYTKNVIADTVWCGRCKRPTLHRVDGGRLGPCIDPKHPVQEFTQAQLERRKKQDEDKRSPRLFD